MKADILVFPGVGAFGSAMQVLNERGYVEPLKQFVASGKPFLGICLGMQLLFEVPSTSKHARACYAISPS